MSLSAEQLADFEKQLRTRERQLLQELEAGKERASAETFEQLAGEVADAGDASVADLISDGVSAERERDRNELREVQDALGRLADGVYGICMRCGEQIHPRRLSSSPTARYDLVHQEEVDRERGAPSTPTL
jgi:RNA polymerase-binding transcription factor DksA